MVQSKTQGKIVRHYGKDSHLCRVTKNANGVIRKYGLMLNRREFREKAPHIGFKKVGACCNSLDLCPLCVSFGHLLSQLLGNCLILCDIVQVNTGKHGM